MPNTVVALKDLLDHRERIAVVGLGYVGLPLATTLADRFSVIGFDISGPRISELRGGVDHTGEIEPEELARISGSISFTGDAEELRRAGIIIVTVPTPIDSHKNPDLSPLSKAAEMIGRRMRKGAVVVFESTVYPGVTEEVCVPILARESGFTYGRDFFVGYSPERINPGDKTRPVRTITKIVSGDTPETLELLAGIYGSVITPGVHRASSIKVAEAAKISENIQRDLNIALVNELAHICDLQGIDTLEVLEAAGTKWNFLPFRPGLVGGHCIGVDPYYMTYRAEELGYHPEVILAGRRINDGMGKYAAQKIIRRMIRTGHWGQDNRIGIFGLSFKPNVPDLRNTRVVDIKAELEDFNAAVKVQDVLVSAEAARREYGLTLSSLDEMYDLDALIIAVPHEQYARMTLDELRSRCRQGGNGSPPLLADLTGIWNAAEAARHGFDYWRL